MQLRPQRYPIFLRRIYFTSFKFGNRDLFKVMHLYVQIIFVIRTLTDHMGLIKFRQCVGPHCFGREFDVISLINNNTFVRRRLLHKIQ